MPRRGHIPKREIAAGSGLPVAAGDQVHQLHDARRQEIGPPSDFLRARWSTIQERTSEDPLKVFRKAVDNVKPAVEVKSRRVGGSNYQVPIEVRPQRRTALALALADRLRPARPENSMRERLANELMDAGSGAGHSRKKKIRIGWRRPTRRSPTIAGRRL